MLLGWANAIKVRAKAIKIQDQQNAKKKDFCILKMSRKGMEILILSFNHFKLSISLNNVFGFFCVDFGF